jgi:hypothetical protein
VITCLGPVIRTCFKLSHECQQTCISDFVEYLKNVSTCGRVFAQCNCSTSQKRRCGAQAQEGGSSLPDDVSTRTTAGDSVAPAASSAGGALAAVDVATGGNAPAVDNGQALEEEEEETEEVRDYFPMYIVNAYCFGRNGML